MKNIAVIPARSGSKGVIDKNIKALNGKPLMQYSIEAAIKSGMFETVHVSTDSKEYAEIAKKGGAEIPFLRDKRFAGDCVSTIDTVQEVIKRYESIGKTYDNVMILQPTSPLRNASDITKAFELLRDRNAEAIVSVCECEHSPLWCNILPEDGNMLDFISDSALLPRQRLQTFYRINGAIYLYKIKYLMSCEKLYTSKTYAYLMDVYRSIDIDNDIDFKLAEIYLSMQDKLGGE